MASVRRRMWRGPGGEERFAWQASYTDQLGKRRTKTFARKRDAEAWLPQTQVDVSRGVHTPDSTSVTVAAAVDNWIEARKREKRESATIRSYESTVRLHVLPFVGREKLSRLNKPAIERLKKELIDSGRSTARVQRAIQYLSMALDQAESDGMIAHNPAAKVRVTRSSRDKKPAVIPAPSEIKDMIEASEPELRPIVLVGALAGLRASEIRALMWGDIDFDASTISVKRRADENCKLGPPKSKAGRRSIPMSRRLAAELKAWKLRCPPNLLDLVFPSPDGKIWHYHNLMNRMFWPMQLRAEVRQHKIDPADGLPMWDDAGEYVWEPKYGLHALRHAAASLWIAEKIDLKRLQTWMGHGSIQTTIDTYGHLFADMVEDAKLIEGADRRLFS